MREIEFRGKYTDFDKWAYGYYSCRESIHYITFKNQHGLYVECEVNPETVGQYTGLKDKKGQKIYEGDVVVSFAKVFTATVEWNNSQCGFSPFGDERTSFFADECEVIGNIHDIPKGQEW